MKKISRLTSVIILTLGWAAATKAGEHFSTFYLEYNPSTFHYSNTGVSNDACYHAFSVGYNYFTPFYKGLGVDIGVKGQLFLNSEKEQGAKYKTNMLSATIPVDLAYDWRISDGFAVYPYAGLYARLNISSTFKEEKTDEYVRKYNLFKKDDMAILSQEAWKRFQYGWQAGVNFRFSDFVTVGGGYFMDFNEIDNHTKIHGFNITLGMNF